MLTWFTQSPERLHYSNADTLQLDTASYFDDFLALYLNRVAQTFISSDYYNYYDLNRVETNCDMVADSIATIKTRPAITTVTNRTQASIDYFDSLNRIEGNIGTIKDAIGQPLTWTTPKTNWVSAYSSFGYADANRLESNLYELYKLTSNVIDEMEYCGAITAGQSFNLGG